MGIHRFYHLLLRAVNGISRRPWLHLLSLFTLAAAFLSFIATLNAAINLDHFLARWVGSAELTVYLGESASKTDLNRLAAAISETQGVARVTPTTPKEARARFVSDLGSFGDMARALPNAAFPSSIDVHLNRAFSRNIEARRALAKRISQVEMVKEVELYDDWFERLSALTLVGRIASFGLGLIALIVAILVVTAVIRIGVNARSKEIEMLGLVGATDRYVHAPFLIEGIIETVMAMLIALLSLHFLTNSAQKLAGDLMPLIGADTLLRLSPTTIFLLLVGSALVGLGGARISLKGIARV